MFANVVGAARLIAVTHAAGPVVSDPIAWPNSDIVKPQKAGKPIGSPKIAAATVKNRLFQKTWMMPLQNVISMCIQGGRVGKMGRTHIPFLGIIAFFVAGPEKSCPDFPDAIMATVFTTTIFKETEGGCNETKVYRQRIVQTAQPDTD